MGETSARYLLDSEGPEQQRRDDRWAPKSRLVGMDTPGYLGCISRGASCVDNMAPNKAFDLSADELCLRVVYICGRCVDFAANEKKYDMNTRIEQGVKLLQALEDWQRVLPSTFQPIYRVALPEQGSLFAPIWIHPPSYAAAVQTFHFARIIVLINQPSMGGMDDFRVRQRFLDESVETICGIAMMHQGRDLPSAFVNFQALYAGKVCPKSTLCRH
jgi:hypothetical protein